MADPVFRRALRNTFLYVALVLPGAVLLGLFIAVLVHGRTRTRWFYQVIYFLPVTSTLIAMATVWQAILHPRLGPINAALRFLGFDEIAFLSEPSLVLPTLAVIGIWQLLGFNMVLFMAGLSAIPRDLYEAAEIDGCNGGLDRFLTITWPLLGPTTMFVIVTTSITAFKVFDTVAVMTRGGPAGASEVLLYTIYLEGFQYFHTAYGAALTLVFLAFVWSSPPCRLSCSIDGCTTDDRREPSRAGSARRGLRRRAHSRHPDRSARSSCCCRSSGCSRHRSNLRPRSSRRPCRCGRRSSTASRITRSRSRARPCFVSR